MIGLLVNLLILVICLGIVYWIVTLILPEPFQKIALAILGLIALLCVLSWVGVLGSGFTLPRYR